MTSRKRVRTKDGLALAAETKQKIKDTQLQMLRKVIENSFSLSDVVGKYRRCNLKGLSRATLTRKIRNKTFDEYFSESDRRRLQEVLLAPAPPPSTVNGQKPFRPKDAGQIERLLDVVPMLDSAIRQLEEYCKKYCPGPTDEAVSAIKLDPGRLAKLEGILDNLADHIRIATLLVKRAHISSLQDVRQTHPEFVPLLDRLERLFVRLITVDFVNPGPQVPVHDYTWICLILAISRFYIRMPDDSLFRLHINKASEHGKREFGMDYAPDHTVGFRGVPGNPPEVKRDTRPNWIRRFKLLAKSIFTHTIARNSRSETFVRGSCWITLVTGLDVQYKGESCSFSPTRIITLLREPENPDTRNSYDNIDGTDHVCHDCHNGFRVKNGIREGCVNGFQHLHFGKMLDNEEQKKCKLASRATCPGHGRLPDYCVYVAIPSGSLQPCRNSPVRLTTCRCPGHNCLEGLAMNSKKRVTTAVAKQNVGRSNKRLRQQEPEIGAGREDCGDCWLDPFDLSDLFSGVKPSVVLEEEIWRTALQEPEISAGREDCGDCWLDPFDFGDLFSSVTERRAV